MSKSGVMFDHFLKATLQGIEKNGWPWEHGELSAYEVQNCFYHMLKWQLIEVGEWESGPFTLTAKGREYLKTLKKAYAPVTDWSDEVPFEAEA